MKIAIKGDRSDYYPKESAPGELRQQCAYGLQLPRSSDEYKAVRSDEEQRRANQIIPIFQRIAEERELS